MDAVKPMLKTFPYVEYPPEGVGVTRAVWNLKNIAVFKQYKDYLYFASVRQIKTMLRMAVWYISDLPRSMFCLFI